MVVKISTAPEVVIEGYSAIGTIDKNAILSEYRFVNFANKYLGGRKVMIDAIAEALETWPKSRPVEIMDIGCGIGEMALAIVGWATKNRYDIRYRGIDGNDDVIRIAKAHASSRGIAYQTADLFSPGLPGADIVIASMIFHKLKKEDVADALEHLLAKARYSLIITDLSRSMPAHFTSFLLKLLIKDPILQFQAKDSFKNGFRISDLEAMLRSLNISGVVRRRFGNHVVIHISKKQLIRKKLATQPI
jgi:2-polyprenyl-3-methyl-5-hydroxy-6-metoxy-1,4-benzoquinol methylase